MATCALSYTVLPSTSTSSSPPSKQPASSRLLKSVQSPSFVRPVTALSAAANGNSSQPGEAIHPQRSSRDSSLQQSRRSRDTTPLLLLDSWDPFSRGGLRQMMENMDRLFMDDRVPSRSGGGQGGNRPASSAGVRAPWDVIEDEEAYHIRVDMPGFSKEDVKVSVEDSVLVVLGERDPNKENSRWAAKSYRKFNTRLALPDNVQLDKISAELKNGVLFVTTPKIKSEDKKQVFNVAIA